MLLHVARVVLILLEVLILFNLLIVVHELGHFLAARWRGVYIEKFGVWFGKPLWKKTINGVQYSLGSLPFGGFVALPQLAPMDIIEGKADMDRARLPKISALDKIIVAIAGPLFSLLLALFLPALCGWSAIRLANRIPPRLSVTSCRIRRRKELDSNPAIKFSKWTGNLSGVFSE